MAGSLNRDVRFGVRMLAKSPGITAVAVLCLALGIGANTAIFSVINGLIFEPLPYAEPEQLVEVYTSFPRSELPHFTLSEPELVDLQREIDAFDGVFAYTTIDGNVSLGTGHPTERIVSAVMGLDALTTLGVEPILGRDFRPDEGTPGSETVVLLRHDLWVERFAGDPGVIGRRIVIDTEPHEVIGVLPPGFVFPFTPEAKIFAPLAYHIRNPRGNHYLHAIGRIRDGSSLAGLRRELSALAGELRVRYPDDYAERAGFDFGATPIDRAMLGPVRPALFVLFGAVGLVLLIACANVASLLLARGMARRHELALRMALGAGRRRLVRQMLTESLVLALVGAAGGLLVALWGIDLLIAVAPASVAKASLIRVEPAVLLFAVGLSVVTGLVFGAFPAFYAARVELDVSLRDGGQRTTMGRAGLRIRNALVAFEVGLALLLLVGAGLANRSLQRMLGAELGFERDGLLTARLKLPYAKYGDPNDRLIFYERLFEQLDGVGASSHLPLASNRATYKCELEGFDAETPPEVDVRVVNGAYFEAMGIGVRAGKVFDEHEHRGAVRTAMVDELLQQRYWPDGAVGRRLRLGHEDEWLTIIGVVAHARDEGIGSGARPQVYLPYLSKPSLRMTLVVRTDEPTRVAAALQARVAALDPELPLYDVKTMHERIRDSLEVQRFVGFLLQLFAMIAIGLALVGVYAVVSFSVAGRSRELGIRVALGARPRQIVGLVVRQGMQIVGVGVAIGLVGAVALSYASAARLYHVGPFDPASYATALAIVGVAGFAASYLAARRAIRVDPVDALRNG